MKSEQLSLHDARAQGIAPWDDTVAELADVVVFRDRFPVSPGHLLFVPRKDTPDARASAFRAADDWGKNLLDLKTCDGYNIGLNQNASAGQTVMYPHVHLIPRRVGDCEDPVGGVRGVIPGQANYRTERYQQP
jgi:diadenosine tetraphosphate (Ap4A) HIT family hydrolase